jgi:hypothetical protein
MDTTAALKAVFLPRCQLIQNQIFVLFMFSKTYKASDLEGFLARLKNMRLDLGVLGRVKPIKGHKI